MPLESGSLNEQDLLLFRLQGLQCAAPELLLPTLRVMGACVVERGGWEEMPEEKH